MVLYEPSAQLHEYADAMKQQFGVELSTARISQIFSRHEINRKKVPIYPFLLTAA